MDNVAPTKWLARFPELAKISDAAWLDAVQAAIVHTIPRETVLFRPGDPCRSFVLVLAGTVRVYIPSES